MRVRRLSTKAIVGLCIGWLIVVSAAFMIIALVAARRAASIYRVQHPANDDYLVTVSLPLAGWWAALLILGPPIALVIVWIVARRSPGNPTP